MEFVMKVRGIIGKKIGMTQIFDDNGNVVPVTVIQAGPCLVMQKKSEAGKDHYSAIKLGFDQVEERKLNKPQRVETQKLELAPMRITREIRMPEDQLAEYEVGSYLKADTFEPGDYVNLTGRSKGRGFAGVFKRFGFGGGKASHGVHEYYRHGGSVGCSAYPGKIWKGKKMPGQYGNTTYTAENVVVVKVDLENNLLLVRGAVPGSRNSLVVIKNSKKKWKRV
jgi:large subunit ribosomal protein L3